MIIQGKVKDLGGFSVARVLPQIAARSVGPFVFYDVMGPADFSPGHGIDVRPHPHIGLATITYLFSGRILHADSLGVRQPIEPGAVNWMTAGRGITHSERTHTDDLANGQHLHGIQAWITLPDEAEDTEPAFEHFPVDVLPVLDAEGVTLRLIAGAGWGLASPVKTRSPLIYAHGELQAGASLMFEASQPERAVHVVSGSITANGAPVDPGAMLLLEEGADVQLVAGADGARLMLLGGASVGDRFLDWNFVASSKERLEQAKADWRGEDWTSGRFKLPPGDDAEWIPLPG
jgi:redox-sensitive bicupin YhaK (pirin superfamily)